MVVLPPLMLPSVFKSERKAVASTATPARLRTWIELPPFTPALALLSPKQWPQVTHQETQEDGAVNANILWRRCGGFAGTGDLHRGRGEGGEERREEGGGEGGGGKGGGGWRGGTGRRGGRVRGVTWPWRRRKPASGQRRGRGFVGRHDLQPLLEFREEAIAGFGHDRDIFDARAAESRIVKPWFNRQHLARFENGLLKAREFVDFEPESVTGTVKETNVLRRCELPSGNRDRRRAF